MAGAVQDTAIRTGRVARTLIYLVLLLFALFYMLPLYVMVVNSVRRGKRHTQMAAALMPIQ